MAQVIKLIISDDLRGKGVEGDPYRRVKQLWTLDGVLIAEDDDCIDKQFFYSNKLNY